MADQTMFLAHVMTYGGAEDLASAERFYTHDAFRRVLQIAPAKIFDPISWHFWHRRLLNVQPPEMPHDWFGFHRSVRKRLITGFAMATSDESPVTSHER